jgi:methyl-accepting chemotaxis protein
MIILQMVVTGSIENALRIKENALEVDANLSSREHLAVEMLSLFDSSQIFEYKKIAARGEKVVRQFSKSKDLKLRGEKSLVLTNSRVDSLFEQLSKSSENKNRILNQLSESVMLSDKAVGSILTNLETRESDLQMMGERMSAEESEFLNIARDGKIFFLSLKGNLQELQIRQDLSLLKDFQLLIGTKSSLLDAFKSFATVLEDTAFIDLSKQFSSSIEKAVSDGSALFSEANVQFKIIKEFKQTVETALLITNKQVASAEKSVADAKKNTLAIYLLVLIITSLLFIVLSISLISSITGPINKLSGCMDVLGKGDFTIEIPFNGTDEISQIASRLRSMVANLSSMLQHVQKSAEGLFLQTTEVNNIADSVAIMIQKQRNRSSEVSLSGNNVSTNVASISKTTIELSKSVTGITESIEDIGTSISEVTITCREESNIAVQADLDARSAEEMMQHLGESAGKIGTVIDVIKSISEQTNLLALNATIEAARAGSAHAETGVVIPTTDAEAFIRGSAEAGVLRIVQ